MNACSVNLFHGGFSWRVGDGTAGIVGFDLIIRESIEQILLPQVLEEILLAPAFEHAMSHHDGTQVPAAGHHRRLMAGFCQTSYLTESKCAVEEADGLIMEQIFHPPTVQLGLVQSESLFRDVADVPLAIGQDVKTHSQQLLKYFWAPTSAIKNNCGVPVRSQQFAYFAYHWYKYFGHGGVGISSDHKQGIATLVVDPIIGGRRCGQMHARHIGFGNLVFAVIGPNVAVYIKKTENLAPPGDALPRDFPTESIAALQSSETCEFTAQCFHFGHAIQADEATPFSRRTLFEHLRPRDPQKRQQNISNQSCAQSVKGGTEAAVNLLGHGEQATSNERRNGQQDTGSGQIWGWSKHRKGIVEKPHGSKKTIHGPIERVGIETFCSRVAWQLRHLIWRLFGNRGWSLEHRACRNHGQLYLRTCFRQEGETWFRTRFPAEPTETLAHGFFAKAEPAGNPTIAHLLRFETENGAVSLMEFLVHGRTDYR